MYGLARESGVSRECLGKIKRVVFTPRASEGADQLPLQHDLNVYDILDELIAALRR
jgi:hypothetical protein